MDPKQYLETQILGADPIELIRLLYRGTINAIEEARRNLAAGDIMARGNSITRAMDCLSELTLSLNLEAGGEFAQRLAGLYGYVQRLLIKAHTEQSEAPLAESVKLLNTLLEGWDGMNLSAPSAAPAYREPEEDCQPISAFVADPFAAYATTAGRSWEL